MTAGTRLNVGGRRASLLGGPRRRIGVVDADGGPTWRSYLTPLTQMAWFSVRTRPSAPWNER